MQAVHFVMRFVSHLKQIPALDFSMALMGKVLELIMEFLLGCQFFGNYSKYLSDNLKSKNNFNKLNKNLKDLKKVAQLVSQIKED